MRKEEFVCEKKLNDAKEREILVKYYLLHKEMNEAINLKEWGIKIELYFDNIVDSRSIAYLYPDYKRVMEIIEILSENDVTPVSLYDTITEVLLYY